MIGMLQEFGHNFDFHMCSKVFKVVILVRALLVGIFSHSSIHLSNLSNFNNSQFGLSNLHHWGTISREKEVVQNLLRLLAPPLFNVPISRTLEQDSHGREFRTVAV